MDLKMESVHLFIVILITCTYIEHSSNTKPFFDGNRLNVIQSMCSFQTIYEIKLLIISILI